MGSTTPVRVYMSNINQDTTSEIMCVITTNPINFTTCNDANY